MATRLKWFSRHPIQSKYVLVVLVAMLAPTALIGFCFYSLVFHLMAKELVFPEAIYGTLAPVIEQTNHLLIYLLPVLFLSLLWWAIVISHRFAGPIERIENDLEIILKENPSHRIRLRKNDALSGVAEKINRLADRHSA